MPIDKREVVALFGDKLKKKLEEDVTKIINKRKVKVAGVSVKKVKDGFNIIFDCVGYDNPANVGVYLLYVDIDSGKKGAKNGKIKIRFRPFVTGVSKEVYEEISEKDWEKKGLKIIESSILDLVEYAIEKGFILNR